MRLTGVGMGDSKGRFHIIILLEKDFYLVPVSCEDYNYHCLAGTVLTSASAVSVTAGSI